jgi:hypothetical protein
MSRTLHFGKLAVIDEVRFVLMDQVHYHVPQQNDIPASDLTMTIEEPQAGALFVRFAYDDHLDTPETAEESFYNDFRREAYKESDIDTIRRGSVGFTDSIEFHLRRNVGGFGMRLVSHSFLRTYRAFQSCRRS